MKSIVALRMMEFSFELKYFLLKSNVKKGIEEIPS